MSTVAFEFFTVMFLAGHFLWLLVLHLETVNNTLAINKQARALSELIRVNKKLVSERKHNIYHRKRHAKYLHHKLSQVETAIRCLHNANITQPEFGGVRIGTYLN
jgi:hypothetical protein